MIPFEELYGQVLSSYIEGKRKDDFAAEKLPGFDPHQLDCLLRPDRHPAILRVGKCKCLDENGRPCMGNCAFDAISPDSSGNAVVSEKDCTGCGECIKACPYQNLAGRKDVLPVLELLQAESAPVYAMIAPAFVSQFSPRVTPGKCRTAFKKLGFSGMIEVALFADILTLKEALEFDRVIQDDNDFLLTSCCCPVWIGMIKKVYSLLVPHIPPSVSPMAACGRSIKKLFPQAKTVFIGPCLAKKAEARDLDIRDAVDHVLTFQEIDELFTAAGIDPENCEEDMRDHSSTAGRIYARTGGVSEAVQNTLNRLVPDREIPLRAQQADGVPACKAMLAEITKGEIRANFIEGMGCAGGCVGGPRVLISKEEGRANVNAYGDAAACSTPVDNPFVIELLARLGFDTIETLLTAGNMFTRDFGVKQDGEKQI